MPARSPKKVSLPTGKGALSRPCQPSLVTGEEGSMLNIPPKKKSSGTKASPDKIMKSSSKTVPSRFTSAKKADLTGQRSLQPETNDENEYIADSSEVKRSTALVEISEVKLGNSKGFSSTDEPAIPGGGNNAEVDEDEEEKRTRTHKYAYMDEEGKINTYYRTIEEAELAMENARKMRNATGDESIGRVITRSLVLWHRKISACPRMIEKLLLCLQYECHKAQIKLPWDKAVHRLNVGSSGTSALQHLNKTRDTLISEGHITPPTLGKDTSNDPPTLRGYARDMDAECPTATRALRWSEHVIHPKKNLEDSGVIKGSGNYRGTPKENREQPVKDDIGESGHRARIPAEIIAETAAVRAAQKVAKRAYKRRTPKAKKEAEKKKEEKAELELESDDEIDPTELKSDDDYHPSYKKQSGGRKSQFSTDDPFTSPTLNSSTRKTSRKNRRPSLILKLSVSSEATKQKLQIDEENGNSQHTKISHTSKSSRGALVHTSGSVGDFGELATEPFNYRGKEIHGEMHEYMAAIMSGSDPLRNGTKYISNLWDRLQRNRQAVVAVSDEDLESLEQFGKREEPFNEEPSFLRNSAGIDSFQVAGGQMEVDIDDQDGNIVDGADGMMQLNYGGGQVGSSFMQDAPPFGSSMHHQQTPSDYSLDLPASSQCQSGDDSQYMYGSAATWSQTPASTGTFIKDVVYQEDQSYAEANEYVGNVEREESPSHFELYAHMYNGIYDLEDDLADAAGSFQQ
ncbi:hypothetical protein PZA11_003343 [Diplocarpon coronariae]